MQVHPNDIDFIKKMNILRLLKKRGATETMRLYPEFTSFILRVKDLNEQQIKELLKEEDCLATH